MPPPPQGHQSAQIVQSTVQWGGRTPKAGGRMLDGRVWDEMPRRPVAIVAQTR
jgi:protein gp37